MSKNNFSSIYIMGGLLFLFLLLFFLEYLFPLRKRKENFYFRLFINLTVSASSFLTAFFLVMPAAKSALGWVSEEQLGFIHLFDLPFLIEGLLAFLLMDAAFYYWHLANHKIPLLWRFHNVHHIDPDLDVSTALRFHFGEISFSTAFRIVQISIIGISPAVYFMYEFVFLGSTIFHHSNLKMPIKLERIINKIFVTPRMHGIHHSQVMNETNSNYSTVFSWWDLLHKTLKLNIPQSKVIIGIPGYSKSDDNNIKNVLIMPFKKQREYWKKPNGTGVERKESELGKSKLNLEE